MRSCPDNLLVGISYPRLWVFSESCLAKTSQPEQPQLPNPTALFTALIAAAQSMNIKGAMNKVKDEGGKAW